MSIHYAFTSLLEGCPKCYAGSDCWQYRKLEDQEGVARAAYENCDSIEVRGLWVQARKALRRHVAFSDNEDAASVASRSVA